MQFLTFGGAARLRPGHGAQPEPVVQAQAEEPQRADSEDLATARAATRLPARIPGHASSPFVELQVEARRKTAAPRLVIDESSG